LCGRVKNPSVGLIRCFEMSFYGYITMKNKVCEADYRWYN